MQPRTFISAPNTTGGAFTFATLPTATQMVGELNGVQAYTTDAGLVTWNGTSWQQLIKRARWGFVASGCGIPDTTGSQLTWMTRTAHVATDDLSIIRVLWTNFAAGTVLTGTGTINATLEYAGAIVQTFTFYLTGGSTTVVIAANSFAWSDPMVVMIPKGATFYIREHRVQSAGNVPNCQGQGNNQQTALGECTNGSSTPVADLTASTGTFSNTQNNIPRPAAIIGMTSNPSILIIGDSRADGTGDTLYNTRSSPLVRTDTANIAPQVYASGFGYCRYALTGQQAFGFQPGTANVQFSCLQSLVTLATHCINDMGINDIKAGGGNVSAATLFTYQAGISSLTTSPKWYLTTLGPITTSSDSWASISGQTVDGDNAQRVLYNNNLRAGILPTGYIGFIEIADFYESSRNSGLWKVNGQANGFTTDGVHAGSTIYDNIAANAIFPQFF